MEETRKIGLGQTVCLLCLIRCFSLFSFSYVENDMENLSAKFLGIFLGVLIDAIVFIPTIFVFKENSGGIFPLARDVSKTFEKIISAIYFIFAIYSAVILSIQFNGFFQSTIYHGGEKIFFIIILAMTAVYGSKKGLEPCARASAIFFVIILLISIGGMFFLFPDINLLNLSTPLYKGFSPVLRLAIFYASESFPICFILAFGKNINCGGNKAFYIYLLATFLIFETVSFLVITVLGEFGAAQPYCVFSLASSSKGEILKRYDSFYMFSWVFTAVCKMTMLCFFSAYCLKPFFPKVKPETKSLFSAVLICILSYIFLEKERAFELALKLNSWGAFLVLMAVILPTLVLFFWKKNKKGGIKP